MTSSSLKVMGARKRETNSASGSATATANEIQKVVEELPVAPIPLNRCKPHRKEIAPGERELMKGKMDGRDDYEAKDKGVLIRSGVETEGQPKAK